ncbi:MAG: hypothetical protein LUC24_06355 [Bacteroidales bacterium]|nr:hypothetical protein [Bacteroidales bacterium]
MKKFFQRILAFLNINGRRDLPALLISLLLAFCIWLFYNLSLKYQEFVTVPVTARCNIEGHAAESSNSCDVVARCRTSGYNIIHFKRFSRKRHVTVSFSRMYSAGGELFYVTSSDLQEYSRQIFGENTVPEYFLTDTLYFNFSYETNKKVPVRAVHELDFKQQYTMVGGVVVAPDSVTVYGEPYMLEKIDNVYTDVIKQSNVDSDIHGVARIEKLRGVRLSDESVRYSVAVSRYVEITGTLPVKVRNVPSDKRLTPYPSSVSVSFKCRFPYKTSHPTDSIEFYVDYNDFIASRGGKCLVKSALIPSYVFDYVLSPEVVECVASDVQ